MSPLAKFFVVINLVLAVCFLGMSAVIFEGQQNWKTAHEKTVSESAAALAEMTKDVEATRGDNTRLSESKSSLETEVSSLKTLSTSLQNDNSNLSKQVAEQRTQLASLQNTIETKDEHLREKDQAIARKDEKISELTMSEKEAQEAKALAERKAGRAELDRQQIAEQLNNLQAEHVAMSQVADEQADALEWVKVNHPTIRFDTNPAPAIDGSIVAVRGDVNLVVLSVGAHEKVEAGFEFTVYRGKQFIGKVRVTRVTDDMAGAEILYLEPGQSVQVGDAASTRLS